MVVGKIQGHWSGSEKCGRIIKRPVRESNPAYSRPDRELHLVRCSYAATPMGMFEMEKAQVLN